MNYANTLSGPRARATEGGRAVHREIKFWIREQKQWMVKSGEYRSPEARKGNAVESLTRGSGQPPRRYGAIDRAKFLRRLRRLVGLHRRPHRQEVEANYGLDPVALGILSDGASKLAFHLFDFAASTISFFVGNAVFVGRSGRKRRSEGGAREKLPRLPSFFLQHGCAPLCSADTLAHSSARPLFGPLDGSKFRELARSVRQMVGYNIGRRYRSGPEERKLGQLSTDESNRRSPPSVYLKRIPC